MRPVLLIAEGDLDLRSAYARLCVHRGLSADTVSDGLECLKRLAARPPDVLLVDLDILWGGGDGVVACARDGARGTIRPAIFVTGFESPHVLSRRSGVSVENCIQKPFRVGGLLDLVSAALTMDHEASGHVAAVAPA